LQADSVLCATDRATAKSQNFMTHFYSISKQNRVKYLSFGDCWRCEKSHAVLSASKHPEPLKIW
jgi:hypothetical protein